MDGNDDLEALLGCVKEDGDAIVAEQQAATEKAVAEAAAEEAAKIASQAHNLREVLGSGFLYWSTSSMVHDFTPDAYKVYRDNLLKDAGDPSDPFEIMLIEQLALSHFTIGRLHLRACTVEHAKLAIGFTDSATRLLGEFRRCSLALEDYRAKQNERQDRAEAKAAAIAASKRKRPVPKRKRPVPKSKTPKPLTNGQKTRRDNKQRSNGHTNGAIPQCIKDRMNNEKTLNGSKQDVATMPKETA